MKTRSPGGERDIDVYVDDAAVMRGYSEIVIRQTGLTSSESDRVTARVAANGAVEGTITHQSVTMPQPDLRSGILLDSAMRVMRAHAKHTSTRASLSAADVARIHAISDWMVKRCPPR
jgi:hypothetical protein